MESEAIKSCFVNKMHYTQMARIILSSCIIRKRVRYVYRIECNFRVIKMPTHSEDKCAADDHFDRRAGPPLRGRLAPLESNLTSPITLVVDSTVFLPAPTTRIRTSQLCRSPWPSRP